MTESALSLQLNKFISYGYRYAWGYREGFTLEDAITFRMVTTSEGAARELADKAHIAVGADFKRFCGIWNLKEELEKLKL